MWIDRQIEPLLLQRAATRPVVVLTGARQTGKTSLMRRLFPNHRFVTLDLPSEADRNSRLNLTTWFGVRSAVGFLVFQNRNSRLNLTTKPRLRRSRPRSGRKPLVTSRSSV